MRKEYDFSNAERGKFYRTNKVQKTLRLDADILEYFQSTAEAKHIGYQTLINSTLREAMEHPHGLVDLDVLKSELKAVVSSVAKLTKTSQKKIA